MGETAHFASNLNWFKPKKLQDLHSPQHTTSKLQSTKRSAVTVNPKQSVRIRTMQEQHRQFPQQRSFIPGKVLQRICSD